MTPLPLPPKPPFYEVGGLMISRAELKAIVGPPHHVETNTLRTHGGEEDVWAFRLPSGLGVTVILRVPYGVAVFYADSPEADDCFSIVGIPRTDQRWKLNPKPVLVDHL